MKYGKKKQSFPFLRVWVTLVHGLAHLGNMLCWISSNISLNNQISERLLNTDIDLLIAHQKSLKLYVCKFGIKEIENKKLNTYCFLLRCIISSCMMSLLYCFKSSAILSYRSAATKQQGISHKLLRTGHCTLHRATNQRPPIIDASLVRFSLFRSFVPLIQSTIHRATE